MNGGAWACPTCTLAHDDGAATACQACGTERQAAGSGGWACGVCTLINDGPTAVCGACGSSPDQSSFAAAFLEPATKRGRARSPCAIQARHSDGTVTALDGVFADTTVEELYALVREQCLVGEAAFDLRVAGGGGDRSALRSSASDALQTAGLAPRATVLVVPAAAERGRQAAKQRAWAPFVHGGFVHGSFVPVALPRAAELAVGCLNVWFDEAFFAQRAAAQRREFEALDCDVVCLQEVTQAYLDVLLHDAWVQRTFWLSHVRMEGYGVAMLSRSPPVAPLEEHALPSVMQRTLLVCHLACGLTAATVHLESLEEYQPTRVRQLAEVARLLAARHHLLLCGDFNFDADDASLPEASAVAALDAVTDVMPPRQPTIGINYPSKKYRPKRFDRALLRSPTWGCSSARLFGQARLAPDEHPQPASAYLRSRGAFLSDHFGLLLRLAPVKK